MRLVLAARGEDGGRRGACTRVGQQLGIPSDTLRGWVHRAEVDGGLRSGRSTDDAEHIAQLEREVRELRRANAILRSASVNSTRQRNSAWSLSAGVSKSRVFLGRELRRAATTSRSDWVRSLMLTPLGTY